MILIFDTETSAKADFKAPYYAPHQPRMLSVCALLYADDGTLACQFSAMMRHSKSLVIDPEAAAKNGLSHELLSARGLPMATALMALDSMFQLAGTVVAFNLNFDRMIIDGEFHRARRLPPIDGSTDLELFCCMEAATDVCKIPSPYGSGKWKWPKLEEAYKFLFNEEHTGAHGATADAMACARIYFELQKRKVVS